MKLGSVRKKIRNKEGVLEKKIKCLCQEWKNNIKKKLNQECEDRREGLNQK